jgi:hypothetical protein
MIWRVFLPLVLFSIEWLCHVYSGFTPQYTGLQKMYEKYKDKGFEIIGFPCNQVRFLSIL